MLDSKAVLINGAKKFLSASEKKKVIFHLTPYTKNEFQLIK